MSVLVVQMGHSGRTSGATGAPGEMAFTEAAGAACVQMLDGRGGWSVRLIRADVASSSYRGDGFVALHADGSTNPNMRGACYGAQTDEGHEAGTLWAGAWDQTYDGPWNPVNYTTNLAQYYGVRNAVAVGNRRAFILEAGTITNAEDRALITSAAGLAALARSVGAAFGIPLEEQDDMYSESDRRRDDAAAWRLHALVMGHDTVQGGPSAGEAAPTVPLLQAAAWREHRALQLDPTLESGVPAVDNGEELPLVDLLRQLADDMAAIRRVIAPTGS